LEAYDEYLRGRFHWEQRGSGLPRALLCFEKAISLDPGFARAHAGLADALAATALWGIAPSDEALPRAKEAAARAMALDPELAEAHAAMAQVRVLWDRDAAGADAEFRRALEIDPRYNAARYWHAAYVLHSALGRTDEAIESLRRAVEFDPLSIITKWNFWFVLYGAGRCDRLVAEMPDLLTLDSDSILVPVMRGFVHLGAGRIEAAVEALRRAVELWSRNHWALAWFAETLIAAGRTDEARDVYRELVACSRERFVPQFSLAAVPAMLGDADSAFAHLNAALASREWGMLLVSRWPWFERLRSDPRYAGIPQRAGLL
jgi:tetratricopeptide (TPR) repeat protein